MKRVRLLWITLITGGLLAFPATAFAQVPDPGDWVDDLTQDMEFMVDGLWYELLRLHAQIQWFLMKIFFVMGIVTDLVTEFLAEHAFAPMITQGNSQFGIAVSMSFTIAILVLGMSYMIAHFIRLNVVEFRSALTWYLLVGLFFQLGPELYLSLNRLRADLNSFFYATALESMNSGSPLAPLNNHLSDEGLPMLIPCDNFGWMNGTENMQAGAGVDGLDIAMAYLLATARDVLGEPPPVIGNCLTVNPGGYEANLPFRWYYTGGYFDTTVSPPTWESIPADDRERSLSMAATAQYRLIGAWPLLWLGIFEKIVYLLVTFAQGLSFISFSVAAIFAFFKRTEAIARAVVDLWIEIIVTSVVIALGQSLVVSLALAAAATQNPLASIGVGLLCAVLMGILMFSGIKLVWNALTRIFNTLSQATGGAFIPPQQLATGAAVGAVGTVAAIATGGGALALAGAAMSGMSASGLGGSALSMAGGQLMMAGRMMGGTQPLTGAAHPVDRPEGSPSEAINMAADDSFPGDTTPTMAATPSPPMPPLTLPGYAASQLQPDHPAGQRTVHLQAQFTPLERPDEPAPPISRHSPVTGRSSDQVTDTLAASDSTTATLRAAFQEDNLHDEAVAQSQLHADNTRDDAAGRTMLSERGTAPASASDTTALAQAGRELQAAAMALHATATQSHPGRVMGHFDVAGSQPVGAVVADAVDMERHYRQQMGKPLLEGVGEQFGGRMAQAMGLEPIQGQPPISDPARFNALGDQALRLGFTGNQVMQVLQEQAQSPDGRTLTPETHAALVQQVSTTTGTRPRIAQQQVGQFLTIAAAMPEEVRLTGTLASQRLQPPLAQEEV